MKFKIYILIIAAALFAVSCSSAKNGQAQQPEVTLDDGYKTTDNDELLIEDKDLKPVGETVVTSKKSSEQTNIVAFDGSKISVMTDGFGNKSETRYFDDDPKLQMVLVRTAANGQKEVFVYGQNGEVKDLPQNMVGGVMNSSADQIARAAGITEPQKTQTVSTVISGATTTSAVTSIQNLRANQIQTEAQPLENTEPQVETRNETLARQTEPTDKNDSSEQAKTPTKLSENLQNYLPKKRKNATTDNE
jgi:hypothetical protein